jgi:hypothetical protein
LRSAKTGPLKENAIRPAVMEEVKILRRVLIINFPEICLRLSKQNNHFALPEQEANI